MVLAHDIDEGSRTKDVKISQGVTFSAMLLAPDTLQGLQRSGFLRPSPIQLHGIPLGKCGFDLLLEAKSGTGKTAVFSIIALEKLNLEKGLQTIILAPTREIAAQICDVIKQIGSEYEGLCVEVVMGGLPIQDDIEKFKKKVHILVGSPGRLRHLIQDKHINVSSVRLLVFDEADKLLEKSFTADINYIFSSLPLDKQVIMSSATYPEKIKELILKYMQSAQHICPDTENILLGIDQRVVIAKYNTNIVKQTKYRFDELLKILSRKPFKQCLVFCNYQARIGELGKMLKKEKWPAEQLYGQQEQVNRLKALKTLQDYGCRILISTDLAARGIDASNVDLVINFEPPFEWQTYLHRIGRAGRFGTYGTAITILSEGKEENKFKTMLSELVGSINLKTLWDDENFHNGSTSPVPLKTKETSNPEPINKKEEPIFLKLWDVLASPSPSESSVIDSFDDHSKSGNEEKTQAESFSTLLESFYKYETIESENISEVTSAYHHLSQPDLPINEYFNFIKKLKEKEDQNISESKDSVLGIIENNNSLKDERYKASVPHTTGNSNSHEGENDTAFSPNSSGQKAILYDCHNATQPKRPEYSGEDSQCNAGLPADFGKPAAVPKRLEYSDEDALRNAGLPTAFGKQFSSIRKTKKNLESYNYKTTKHSGMNTYSNQPSQNTSAAQTHNENRTRATSPPKDIERSNGLNEQVKNNKLVTLKSLQSGIKNNFKHLYHPDSLPVRNTSKTFSSHTFTKCDEETDSQDSYVQSDQRLSDSSDTNTQKSLPRAAESSKNTKSASSRRTYKVEYDRTSLEDIRLYKDYITWYNTLKYRTQQLEYSIYVEELSKI